MLTSVQFAERAAVLSIAALGLLLSGCDRRPGLNQTGYTAFVFALDAAEHGGAKDLATRVAKAVLKRLDPEGRYGIVCVPIAPDQIEVRVQHPPEDVRELGRAFEKSFVKLAAVNVEREELLAALRLEERSDAALDQLVRGHPARRQKLAALVEAYDTWRQGGSELAYWSALKDLLETNISVNDVRFTLELTEPGSTERKEWLEEGRKQFPHLRKGIDEVVARHRAWRAKGAYLEDPGEIKLLLRGMGVLEFRILAEHDDLNPDQLRAWRERLHRQVPAAEPTDTWGWFRIADPLSFLSLDSAAELETDAQEVQLGLIVEREGEDWFVLADRRPERGLLQRFEGTSRWCVKAAEAARDDRGRAAITFELDQTGGRLLAELTRANLQKPLGVFVDDVAQSFATVQSTIRTHGMITGDFGLQRASFLVRVLEGQLPARLKFPPTSERVVAPQP